MIHCIDAGTRNRRSPYAQLPHVAMRVGLDQWVAYASTNDAVRELDDRSLRVLSQCRGGRSIDDHLLQIVAGGEPGGTAEIREILRELTAKGLLYRIEYGRTGSGTRARTANAAKVGIITADRPDRFERCLASVVSHCRHFGAVPEIFVVDASLDAGHRSRNSAFIRSLRSETGARIWHVGRAQVATMRRALADRDVDERAIEFALGGGIGANRNVLTLLTLGHNLVTFDDDVVCSPWALPDAGDQIVLGGHDDCHDVTFCESREAAVAGLPASRADFIEAHNRLLGRSLTDVVADGDRRLEIRDACRHLLWWLHRGERRIVRMSFPGLAGDAGVLSPYATLLYSGAARRRVLSDPSVFAMALRSREKRRIVRAETITHRSWCMTACAGFSNQELLPPFIPSGRGEDGVFGATLTYIEPGALSVHLPLGIIHDSDRSSSYPDSVVSAWPTRLCDFIMAPLQEGRAATALSSRSERMKHLGRTLCELGDARSADFGEFAACAALASRCRIMAAVDDAHGDGPDYWQDAFDTHRRSLIDSASDPGFYIPDELGGDSIEERKRRLQSFMRQFGNLLCVWPDVVAAARTLSLDELIDGSVSSSEYHSANGRLRASARRTSTPPPRRSTPNRLAPGASAGSAAR